MLRLKSTASQKNDTPSDRKSTSPGFKSSQAIGPSAPRKGTQYFTTTKQISIALNGQYQNHVLDITYTNTPQSAEIFFEKYASDRIGFDIEEKPVFKAGQKTVTSLLQFAPMASSVVNQVVHHPVLLYSIFHDNGRTPVVVQQALMNSMIKKYGVGIHTDRQVLKAHLPSKLSPKSFDAFVELGPMAFAANVVTRPGIGLKHLITELLGVEAVAYKKKRTALSDWERLDLNEKQLKYAAMDAFAAIEIYTLLSARLAAIRAGNTHQKNRG